MMPFSRRLPGLAFSLGLFAGCAGLGHVPPQVALRGAPAVDGVSVEPSAPAEGTRPGAPAPSPPAAARGGAPSAPAPRSAPMAPSGSPGGHAARPGVSTTPSSGKPAVGPPSTVPSAAASPPLDLESLEVQLRETKAISTFTKLTLKNQIDDLLERLRAFYQGQLKTSLAELRRSFDLLVMKVLALLQDADPPLAGALASSRESIWGVLSDPAKLDKF